MYKNIGWTLGNACPCNCKHCYSLQVREKGIDLSKKIIDRVIQQLMLLEVDTVNFGGNEPIFTNGLDVKKSMLPYIINELTKRDVKIGLTSSGISVISLEKLFLNELKKINDIDISIDSPFEKEHDNNRGKNVFRYAIQSLKICNKYNIDCTIVMCAMKWNFTEDRIFKLVNLAKKYNANMRINMLKPTEKKHLGLMPTEEQISKGYNLLMKLCHTINMSDPILAGSYNNADIKGCSCGISSLRINSITPDGKISISPCVYMHHHQTGNLLKDNILDIVNSKEFQEFKNRNQNYNKIEECIGCPKVSICRGGCSSSAYWYNYHKTGNKDMFKKDPYCFIKKVNKDSIISIHKQTKSLVHENYLCTWIGKVKDEKRI